MISARRSGKSRVGDPVYVLLRVQHSQSWSNLGNESSQVRSELCAFYGQGLENAFRIRQELHEVRPEVFHVDHSGFCRQNPQVRKDGKGNEQQNGHLQRNSRDVQHHGIRDPKQGNEDDADLDLLAEHDVLGLQLDARFLESPHSLLLCQVLCEEANRCVQQHRRQGGQHEHGRHMRELVDHAPRATAFERWNLIVMQSKLV
mmetsp:Transcript_1079/g.4575  ORF Transcript_1079/g.4575 Transcript_1079/m.4575 type:complete len:202 (-) Transcript_1079:1369-1974(-)